MGNKYTEDGYALVPNVPISNKNEKEFLMPKYLNANLPFLTPENDTTTPGNKDKRMIRTVAFDKVFHISSGYYEK
jgi:hypothetical protein